MRIAAWAAAVPALLLFLAGCTELSGPGAESIAGLYLLDEVDGQPVPCCAQPDSSGTTVTIVSGRLFLGAARPTSYAATPAGIALAGSCVHEIPNGAWVDTANVVHRADGSSYKLPRCGDGPYTLVLTRRLDLPDGTSRISADTAAGLYTWGGNLGMDATRLITLVDSGLGGTVTLYDPGATILVARQHVGPPDLWPHEPEYLFGSAAD